MLCQLLPQATFKAMGFFLLGPRLVDFHRNLHESWEISWGCCRFATVWQIQNVNALAQHGWRDLQVIQKEITKVSPALRQGWNPRLELTKTNALGTHHFLDMFFFRRALRIKAEA